MFKFFATMGIAIYPLIIIGKFVNEINISWVAVITSILWIPFIFFIFISIISFIMFLVLYITKNIGCKNGCL